LAHEYFIAKKIFLKKTEGKKVARPIVRISMISIALAIVVNLLTIAVVIGFQKEVREKITGFSSHAYIMNVGESSIYESEPIRKNQAFFTKLKQNPAVSTLQGVAFKPVLLQSEKRDSKVKTAAGKDSSIVQQDIQGGILKGVDANFDWSFYKENIVAGRLPNFKTKHISNEILLSQSIATDLNFKVGDSVRAYFVKNSPVMRYFRIAGIYHTGLEEFDKKMVLGDLRQVQLLNDWGIQASIELMDTLSDGYVVLRAEVQGGDGYYDYDWGKGFGSTIGIKICPSADTTFRLIVREYKAPDSYQSKQKTEPDTAYLTLKVKGEGRTPCNFPLSETGEILRTFSDPTGLKYSIKTKEKEVFFTSTPGKGSAEKYVGGFEINFKEWNEIDKDVHHLKEQLTFMPTEHGELVQVTSIKENQEEIFLWLDFLDLNVLIILVLMIVIGIINVGAALLVMILVKTQFIGIMKAMGSVNWQIRKIFLYQAFFIIGKGMIWGNAIGLGLCFLQVKFGILKLNPEVYYLDQVPISITWWQILLLNIVTLIICLLAMIGPSALISRVLPTKAIKFQ
jgi:lipoprotein-releasing system permease protein